MYPMLLLDDVSSELDRPRTALLFEFLRDMPGQIFLSTTQPALVSEPGFARPRPFSTTSFRGS